VLGLSGTFSCYFASATGDFYTVFEPDEYTIQVASSANPAYAQCIVSNYLTSEDFDYVPRPMDAARHAWFVESGFVT